MVAYSSGNHAQAVALAARILAMPATIVMPHDAPAAKVAATLGYGAEVVRYDRFTEDREAIGAALAEARGLTLVPPYDHPDVLAGQGTAALELFTDVGALDALFVPLGGGGLLAGSLLAAEALAPSCRVYGVEPEAGDDGRRSLAAGEIVRIDVPATIADGAQTTHLGAHTFPIIQRAVAEIRTAIGRRARRGHAGVRGHDEARGGADGLPRAGRVSCAAGDLAGQRVGVLVSGGNVDLDRYAALLSGTTTS